MNMKRNTRYIKICITIPLIMITVIACSTASTGDIISGLEETLSVQNTWITHLSTQVAGQEQTNWDQWEAVGHLYTKMPYALGTITPIPPGVTITPTRDSLIDQDTKPTFTPTPSLSIDIEYPPDTRTGIDGRDI